MAVPVKNRTPLVDGNQFFPGREEVFKQRRSAGCTGQTSHEIWDG